MDTIKSIRSNPSFKQLFSFDENIVVSTSETTNTKPQAQSKKNPDADKKTKEDLINQDPLFFR